MAPPLPELVAVEAEDAEDVAAKDVAADRGAFRVRGRPTFGVTNGGRGGRGAPPLTSPT